MSWTDRFDLAAKSLDNAWGAAWDLATSPFDDDGASFSEVVGNLGQLTAGAAGAVGNTLVGAAGAGLWAVNKTIENVVLEPMSTVVTAESLAKSPTWDKGFFDSDTWSKAHEIAQWRSFGQSTALAFATDDILAEQEKIDRLKESFLFNAVSGTIDAAANIFLDPLIVVGKVGSAARAVNKGFGAGHRASDLWLQRQIAKRTNIGQGDIDPWDYAQSDAVTKFLQWSAGKNGRQIANHEAVAASPYSTVIAGLLDGTDIDTGRLIIATAYGSKHALERLAIRRDDLAMRVGRADNQVNFALQYEVSKGWRNRMPVPPTKQKPKPRRTDVEEQIPLFDIQAFPAGRLGPGGGNRLRDPEKGPTPVRGEPPTGAPGQPYDYNSISGNVPETIRGKYYVAPKSGRAPYYMPGPVNADNVKELVKYFRGNATGETAAKWEQLNIPGLPPKAGQWWRASSWDQHADSLATGRSVDDWDEQLSARLMPWDRQSTKWFMSFQRELAQKSRKELDLMTAAAGSGGESRGVWNSMIHQTINSDKQIRKADKTLAYDWESRSLVAEKVIHPKAFGLPVRVIQSAPFALMRSFTEKRAPSWIDPNRGDSHAAVAAYLNKIDVIDPHSKDDIMRRYMKAFEPSEKKELLARVEATAITLMAKKYGLSDDAASEIAKTAVGQRNSVISQIRKHKAGREDHFAADIAVTERNFPFEDFPVDDDLIPVTSKIFETQEVNSIPLLDLDRYDRAFRMNSELLGAFDRGSASIGEFMDQAYDVLNPLWSFSVLMRFGYTVRTLTDDMLRIWASLGGMSVMGNIHAGAKNMLTSDGQSWRNLSPGKGALGQRAKNAKTRLKVIGADAYRASTTRGAGAEDVARLLSQQVDEMGRDLGSVRTVNDLGFTYKGKEFGGAYGGKGSVYRQVTGGSYDAIARTTGEIMEKLRSDYAGWDVKSPGDPDHMDSWVYTINNQIAKSAIGRRYLMGETAEQVEHWLRYSAQGQQVRKKIGLRGRDPQRLAGEAQAVTDQYVPLLRDTDDPLLLRTLALKGELDAKTLEKVFPDVLDRPQVHGPTVDLNLHQGAFHQYVDPIISNGFKWLNQLPSDKLMRHPTFRTLYQDSIRKQHDLIVNRRPEDPITVGDMRAMEHVARAHALRGVNGLLYNVATKSNAAHLMRFMTSFFSAWEDSITKWGRIAMDKPQLLFLGSKIWEAPNEMNLGSTEDEYGNRVPRVQVVDSQGRQSTQRNVDGDMQWGSYDVDGTWKAHDPALDDETRIIARLPKWALKHIPGAESFDAMAIPKSSLNLILQGNPWWAPGAGPLVQIPISAIAAKQPTVKDVYDWAIPFGQQSVADVLLPGWAKQAIKSGLGVEDPAYAAIYLRIMETEEMRVRLDKRERPATPALFAKEIEDRAQAAFKIRSYTRFFLPFTADLQTPYQAFVDQYQQMAEVYGPEADDRFYERYGDDLYLFATALSKNNTGLRATESAWKASKEFKGLIEQNPEYGALIVGPDVNKGDFNQYVYSAQFSQNIAPGSDLKSRERRSPIEAIKANDRSVGWIKYTKYMGLVDQLAESGRLTGEQLSAARSYVGEFVGERHKEWWADFNDSDRLAMPKRIEFFTALSKDPKIINNPLRTDIRVLGDYLGARKEFIAYLAGLKAKGLPFTLQAAANKRIADEWTRVKEAYALSDTRFAELYWRYLGNDNLQA